MSCTKGDSCLAGGKATCQRRDSLRAERVPARARTIPSPAKGVFPRAEGDCSRAGGIPPQKSSTASRNDPRARRSSFSAPPACRVLSKRLACGRRTGEDGRRAGAMRSVAGRVPSRKLRARASRPRLCGRASRLSHRVWKHFRKIVGSGRSATICRARDSGPGGGTAGSDRDACGPTTKPRARRSESHRSAIRPRGPVRVSDGGVQPIAVWEHGMRIRSAMPVATRARITRVGGQ